MSKDENILEFHKHWMEGEINAASATAHSQGTPDPEALLRVKGIAAIRSTLYIVVNYLVLSNNLEKDQSKEIINFMSQIETNVMNMFTDEAAAFNGKPFELISTFKDFMETIAYQLDELIRIENSRIIVDIDAILDKRGKKDHAMAPGGIDLSADLLDLQIKRDSNGVPLPLPQQPIHEMKIDGFLPIIINITPVTNIPLLIGRELPSDGAPIQPLVAIDNEPLARLEDPLYY